MSKKSEQLDKEDKIRYEEENTDDVTMEFSAVPKADLSDQEIFL